MTDHAAHADGSVGLRELRHRTGEVLARVRRGEIIEVTARGRLIARIVPVGDPAPPSPLQRMIDAGRVRPAARPGHRPPPMAGDGVDRLGHALAELRDAERW